MIDVWATTVLPAFRAKMTTKNSGRLPSVDWSTPVAPGPSLRPTCSVAKLTVHARPASARVASPNVASAGAPAKSAAPAPAVASTTSATTTRSTLVIRGNLREKVNGMATIDFHQHLWPEPLVNALRSRTAPPRIVDSRLELASLTFPFDPGVHVLANRLAELDRDGIDTAVVCLQPTLAAPLPRELVDAYHESILAVAAEADGRIVPLAAGVVLDGFAGACVPAPALLDLDGLAPLLDQLLARRQLLFVHPGPDAGIASAGDRYGDATPGEDG